MTTAQQQRAVSPRERYTAGLRRTRLVYAVALGAVVAVFGTIFIVVWATGSAAHATLHTASRVPADLPLRAATAQQARAWSSTDRLAQGAPQFKGTLITFSAHTVTGRDARTGAATWTYTRSDRTVCAAAQLGGYTVAVFDRSGNCDEVDTFDSATGARRWARTLDQDGQPVDGIPTFQWTTQTFLVTTPSVVYAVDPVSGLNRWTYARYGCRIEHALLGTAGALISQDCGASVSCANVTSCTRGPQLLLRDGTAGKLDNSKANFDKVIWSRADYRGVPTSADTVLTAVQPGSATVDVLSTTTGRTTRQVPVHPSVTADAARTVATDSVQVLWSDGVAHAITSAGDLAWTLFTTAVPTVIDAAGDTVPPDGSARLTMASASGVVTVDPATGSVTSRYPVSVPAGSEVVPVGSGFAVGSRTGTVVYR